jgi:hypothetical protein
MVNVLMKLLLASTLWSSNKKLVSAPLGRNGTVRNAAGAHLEMHV